MKKVFFALMVISMLACETETEGEIRLPDMDTHKNYGDSIPVVRDSIKIISNEN